MSPEIIKFFEIFFLSPEKSYQPAEVRKIRRWLEMSLEEFGSLFHQSAEAVKSWESPEDSEKHRVVSGATARVMQLVEWVALAKRSEKNAALLRALWTAYRRGKSGKPEDHACSFGKIGCCAICGKYENMEEDHD